MQRPGWHKLWQAGRRPARTVRIFEDQEVSQGVLSRSEAVLILQSSVLNRPAALIPQSPGGLDTTSTWMHYVSRNVHITGPPAPLQGIAVLC